jgi:hypothetical protein
MLKQLSGPPSARLPGIVRRLIWLKPVRSLGSLRPWLAIAPGGAAGPAPRPASRGHD